MKRTSVHKFLGNLVNDKGNLDDQLKYMEGIVGGFVSEANKICCQKRLFTGLKITVGYRIISDPVKPTHFS